MNQINDRDDIHNNAEGYSDPTAYSVYRQLDFVEKRFRKLLRMIFQLCEIAGFELQGRITLVDKRTGKTWN